MSQNFSSTPQYTHGAGGPPGPDPPYQQQLNDNDLHSNSGSSNNGGNSASHGNSASNATSDQSHGQSSSSSNLNQNASHGSPNQASQSNGASNSSSNSLSDARLNDWRQRQGPWDPIGGQGGRRGA